MTFTPAHEMVPTNPDTAGAGNHAVAVRCGRARCRCVLVFGGLVAFGGALAVWILWYRAPLEFLPTVDDKQLPPQAVVALDEEVDAVKRSPRSDDAWGRLGMALMAYDFHREADQCYEQAERLNPREFRWPYLRGVSRSVSDRAIARMHFERAVELHDGLAVIRLRLAEVLFDEGRLDAAEEQFRSALRLDPTSARARLGMARILCRREEWAAALPWAQDAVRTAPDRRSPRELLAQISFQLRQPEAAQEQLEAAHQLGSGALSWDDPIVAAVWEFMPRSRRLTSEAGELLAYGKVDDAIRRLAEAVQLDPGDVAAHSQLARLLIQRGELARAAVVIDEALRRHPEIAELHFQQGVVNSLQQRWRIAADEFTTAIRQKPDHALAHFNLGHCRRRLGDETGALSAFRDAVRFQPMLAGAHANIGRLLLARGDVDGARRSLQTAIRLDPDDPMPRQLLKKADDSVR